jgi:membrane-bound lytic murein transglycosylase D
VHSISTDSNRYSADSTIHHKIQSGDTLWSISRKYNVKLEQIALWNNMRSNSPLVAGKHIRISALPSDLASDQAEALRKINYLVRADDSLTDIAQRYNVSVSSIRQWNRLDKSDRLQPGQALTLYVN